MEPDPSHHLEEEVAELVAILARRTRWESVPEPDVRQETMTTNLIEAEQNLQVSAPLLKGMRVLAQWSACDIHDAVKGLPRLGGDV